MSKKMLALLLVVVGFVAVANGGCSSGSGKTGSVCSPGDVGSCRCDGGKLGQRTCAADGSGFGACSCGPGTCAPGTRLICTCPDGATGLETCDPSGAFWGACACSTACSDGRPTCGGSCCDSSAVCVADATGNRACAKTCTSSSGCTGATNCCVLGGAMDNTCQAFHTGLSCRCESQAECASGAVCAPHTTVVAGSLVPDGSYYCANDDGKNWDGCGTCGVTGACSASSPAWDCWRDSKTGSKVCAQGCAIDSDCGNPGIACCKPATCANCATSCGTTGVCLPC